MACLGVVPGVAGWKVQTNPLSYGGTPKDSLVGEIGNQQGTLRKELYLSISLVIVITLALADLL